MMARNVCLDCGYFLNYVKAHRTITKIENRKEYDHGKFGKKNTKTTINERT